ncbi:hypothetical protein SASPL_147703 [Salvia splendens]|uniref:Heat shock 70kDa protein 1/8 n=1 Tax=Salvia splendens TaxID=180675 RepID=A0A8X8Z6D6_SALSN|nr:hypothetical protein SASPL_147703 [Salvia splendens]
MAGKGEGRAIGIDLGTTYSCVVAWKHDRIEIIPNDQGNRTTPSQVAFTATDRLIDDAAKNQVANNPINTPSLLLASLMAGTGYGQAIGIDLGTTYSCVAAWKHDRFEIIPNDQGNRTTPSQVAFTDSLRLIGDAAKNQVAKNPFNTVFGAWFKPSLLLASLMAGTGYGQAIGIDLGTTYSCVAAWKHDRFEIIPNDQGNRTTPSQVAFTHSLRLIGDAAKNQVAKNPFNTVFDIYIGKMLLIQ